LTIGGLSFQNFWILHINIISEEYGQLVIT